MAIILVLFGFTTLIGWAYYGEKFLEYLGGKKMLKSYRLFFALIILLGSAIRLDFLGPLTNLLIGLMILINGTGKVRFG